MKRLILGVCLALACGSAFAEPPDALAAIDARRKACLDKAQAVTAAIGDCEATALKASDQVLNRVYGDWIGQLKRPAKGEASDSAEILKRLIASERSWIAYRDANCTLASISMLGGTGEDMAAGECLYATTRQRVLDLQRTRDSR